MASPCQIATSRAPEVTLQGFFGECRLKRPSARQPIAKANNSAGLSGSKSAEKQSFSGFDRVLRAPCLALRCNLGLTIDQTLSKG
jgi:hypothetical protein